MMFWNRGLELEPEPDAEFSENKSFLNKRTRTGGLTAVNRRFLSRLPGTRPESSSIFRTGVRITVGILFFFEEHDWNRNQDLVLWEHQTWNWNRSNFFFRTGTTNSS